MTTTSPVSVPGGRFAIAPSICQFAATFHSPPAELIHVNVLGCTRASSDSSMGRIKDRRVGDSAACMERLLRRVMRLRSQEAADDIGMGLQWRGGLRYNGD